MKFSVIMPAYNEEDLIDPVLDRVLACAFIDELVIIDDGSADQTLSCITKRAAAPGGERITVIPLERNYGKGYAVRQGFKAASGEILAILDADFEYNPQDFLPMLELIRNKEADAVYGSRFLKRPEKVGSLLHFMGNRFLTWITNFLYKTKLTDMETCLKMFRKEIIEQFAFKACSFNIEPEITACICKGNWIIKEVPVDYLPRTRREGKKIHWYHGIQAVLTLLRHRS